ncbi:MAG: hypothetical protein AAF557_01905 [Pseudomonadota bacterium]
MPAIVFAAMGVASAEETPVSPSEFRAFAEGYTLYFHRDGEPFGSESFSPGGNTTWRYNDGSCVNGAWRPHGAQLCFLYEADGADGDVLCWRMLRTDKGDLIARLLQGENAGLELRVTGRDKKPLLCGDPGTAT